MEEISRYAVTNNLSIDKLITEVVSGKREVRHRKLGRQAGFCPKMKILQENEAKINEMKAAGMNNREIYTKLKISKSTFYKYCKSL